MPASKRPHPVRLAALEQGETLHEVADAVGVTASTLRTALQVGTWPSLRERIAQHLGKPESELFPEGNDDLVAAARELAARTRRAQGLPDTVQDVAVLERIGRTLSRAPIAHPDEIIVTRPAC